MTTIDAPKPNAGSADDWAMGITRALNEQRARARSFLKRQRARQTAQTAGGAAGSGQNGSHKSELTDVDLATMAGRLMNEVEQLRVELSHARRRTQTVPTGSTPSADNGDLDTNENALRKELDELRAERQHLLDRLAQSEKDPGCHPQTELSEQQHDDLRRRFEMAVEDVRELKACNAELEEKLRQGARGEKAAVTNSPSDTGLDWEAQKQRLLAQLDDFDDEEARDKLTVDGAIRITDQVVAEKEKEIAELKAQLAEAPAEQKNHPGAADLIGNDEAIQRERAKLMQLQDDWKQKLRKAEVEISVEKAKVARERTQLEEQLHVYEARLAEQEANGPTSSNSDQPKKLGKRRWLSRLGLADDD
jgi:hypothetical protein